MKQIYLYCKTVYKWGAKSIHELAISILLKNNFSNLKKVNIRNHNQAQKEKNIHYLRKLQDGTVLMCK